nr:MAG TPA: hypothetical protein [Caudoviricetes sp.]
MIACIRFNISPVEDKAAALQRTASACTNTAADARAAGMRLCEFVCRMRKGAPGSWKKRERPENGLKPGFLGRKRPGKSGKSADFTT